MASRNIVIKKKNVVLNQPCSSLWTSRSWFSMMGARNSKCAVSGLTYADVTSLDSGLFLIYRKLKSLIIHISRVEIINHSYNEEYSGHRGRNSGHRGRNSGHRGTVGSEKQWAQRNSRHKGTVGTEEQ